MRLGIWWRCSSSTTCSPYESPTWVPPSISNQQRTTESSAKLCALAVPSTCPPISAEKTKFLKVNLIFHSVSWMSNLGVTMDCECNYSVFFVLQHAKGLRSCSTWPLRIPPLTIISCIVLSMWMVGNVDRNGVYYSFSLCFCVFVLWD